MSKEQPKEATPIARRIMEKDVTIEELRHERESVLKELKLRPLTIFDSCEKSGGRKDVIGCETQDGKRVILRLGERRPEWFFPEGFLGQTLRIPRQLHVGGQRIPYEVEEWIPGIMVCDRENEWSKRGQLSPSAQDKLIRVFWEFQNITSLFPLEQLFTIDRLQTFFREAGDLVPPETARLIQTNQSFWNAAYPSKWKFATDNLIIDDNDKVVLIDNVKVGARYFGYDLGFLIWPRWVEMETDACADIEGHLKYLDTFKQKLLRTVPSHAKVPEDIGKAFDLMLFERLVASLYDAKREARHFADWGMAGETGKKRCAAHAVFIQKLLSSITARLSG